MFDLRSNFNRKSSNRTSNQRSRVSNYSSHCRCCSYKRAGKQCSGTLRKKPLTAYEFGIIRKSITNRKADRLCRTAFSGISMPENHTPLSCFKIDGLKIAQKPTRKPQVFVSKIIKFQNQSLSYSLSINPKARCIKSC